MKRLFQFFVGVTFMLHSPFLRAQFSEAEQKAFLNHMTPGKEHSMLAKADGVWTETISMWMAPDAPVISMVSECKNEMIMGGRYQLSSHYGEMMGMPFTGQSLTGFDNSRKVFVSSWIDNMSTGMMYMEGTWNDATQSIEFKGKTTDPMTGLEIEARQVFTFKDENMHTLEMYIMHDTQEYKSMEIIFKRK
jgi:hypothetical protein